MRITFLLPGLSRRPIGGFRVVYEYANHLAGRGHEVTVVHPRRLPNYPPSPGHDLYGWLRRKGAWLRDYLLPAKIGWQPIDGRVKMVFVPEPSARYFPDVDAIFATSWATAECITQFPASKGEKFYLIQHYETWDGPKERVDATWRAPLHKVVISRWLYELGGSLGGGDMACIPNGFRLTRYRVLSPISARPKRVAMLLSHHKWKGSDDGLRALSVVKERHQDLQAALFGVSKPPPGVPSWAKYYRNPSQEFLIRDIYNGSGVFVCPSWTEGFPLPPAEAMACGCALVSTSCGGISEYAEHSVTALLSPPRDPEALAANLLRVLADDDLRIRLALEGHKRIQAFTWERSTNLLEEFIRSRLSRSPGHGGHDVP